MQICIEHSVENHLILRLFLLYLINGPVSLSCAMIVLFVAFEFYFSFDSRPVRGAASIQSGLKVELLFSTNFFADSESKSDPKSDQRSRPCLTVSFG